MNIILMPFSWLLKFFDSLVGNYGLALILFAIVTKIILFPFSLKGKRSMIQTTMLQGQVQRLQKQYANNKQKCNEEVQKLYEKEHVNPMSGCLWSFLPLLLLIPLHSIIRQPMQYMMGAAADQVAQAANSVLGWATSAFSSNGAAFQAGAYNELFATSLINSGNLAEVAKIIPGAFVINFNFLGMNLAQVPTWQIWTQTLNWNNIGLFLMPILSAGLSVVMGIVSTKTNNLNKQEGQEPAKSNKMLTLVSPLLSLWIGYAMPAGLCVYWIINNVLSIVQEIICGKLLKKDYEAAAEAQRQRAILEKEEEKRKKQALAAERAKRIEEQKANKKKKKSDLPPGTDATASRVGIRAYARGRAYDPNRYGAVTPYRDPAVDEAAIEKALEAKAEAREEAELEARVTAQVAAQVEEDFAAGKLTGEDAETKE